jgi:hypothetical protein
MPVTRRELFSRLPAVLLPAILPSEASAQQDVPMPSAMGTLPRLISFVCHSYANTGRG